MPTSSSDITSFTAASAAAAQLAPQTELTLPGGVAVHVKRLSWLEFETAWAGLSALLSAIANTPADAAPEQYAQALCGAPGCVLKLCALSTELTPAQLSALPYDSVLAIAAETLALNFIDNAGVRRFFAVMARLPGAMGAA
jgi:hypothetical protein